MAYIIPNTSLRPGIGEGPSLVSRFVENVRRELSSRLLERRIYNASMQELWEMPDSYRLELGIDPYEYERFARDKARRESGRQYRSWSALPWQRN